MLDSLLDQVDWLEVTSKVAKNRAPFIYCNAVEKILLGHIYQLVKAESQDGKGSKPKSSENENGYGRNRINNEGGNSEYSESICEERDIDIDGQEDDYNMQIDNNDNDDDNSEFNSEYKESKMNEDRDNGSSEH